jgi:hypothetical protein
MSRIPTLKDLKKKFRKRFLLASIFLTIWLLADEWIKEGYLFDFKDVFIPGTHEFFIIILIFLDVVIYGRVTR